ncbi:MAG: polysaccharide deacetylase family protein [Hydrogenothermaceae bacterium]|nr:polysaccharide deacetylase family protein [Hydrogenothermaceae bacterium]
MRTVYLFISLFLISKTILAEVIERLPTDKKVVAITLDACETKTPSYLDREIINFLVENNIPFTLFVSGKFITRNRQDLIKLHKTGLVSIQNHSMNHFQHMEKLSLEEVKSEILENEKLIKEITGIKPMYFRFPGGNYDQKTLQIVESLNYRVVHWTFPSGDPDKSITPQRLASHVISKTSPGAILIFHANGRGYSTGEALPKIVSELRSKGYRFVFLEDFLR